MSRWTIDEATTLEFDGVVALKATLIAGGISVLAGDAPSLRVGEVTGPPLEIGHEAGILTIGHERTLERMLGWLRDRKAGAAITVTVPRDCPVQLNLVTADAVVSGLNARTVIRSASGDVTLDGVVGDIDAHTVSGRIEAQGLEGAVGFTSVSGDLALAGGALDRLGAHTVSGRVAVDMTLVGDRDLSINTVSGEVALRLPESTSAQVVLTSAAGRIATSFPGLTRTERPVARNVIGTLGNGTGHLIVNTVSGGVTLLSRPDDPTDPTDEHLGVED
ncbi:DUF4097 family beta strand repeat-containing protein [Thermomonospora umbrina]|uniref:Putative adhesin n=1 Tax=Thermomonospora umbrina TaxID=111806 RepID=A0A3D9SST3_9ACTN|nr:DUF4097 family beta strand repeat-containing protein [Thermomonospora umbrina]REE98848.1 putative adhesin [Thermomonospora umbrina]